MLNLRTILSRLNEQAAEEQTDARENGPRVYPHPLARTVILANSIYKLRHEVRRTV